jgi:hypothetical protein
VKFLLIWFAIINGERIPVNYEEPETFATLTECAAEVYLLTPKIDALLNRSLLALRTIDVVGICTPVDN